VLGAAKIELLPFNPATGGKYSWLGLPDPLPNAKRQPRGAASRSFEAICRECGLMTL
jgi:hypothetical protein